MNLDAKRFGLAAGILWGISLFGMTLASLVNGYGRDFLVALTSVYPGYTISCVGSAVGLVYGFLDGFVSTFVLVWIYNQLGKK